MTSKTLGRIQHFGAEYAKPGPENRLPLALGLPRRLHTWAAPIGKDVQDHVTVAVDDQLLTSSTGSRPLGGLPRFDSSMFIFQRLAVQKIIQLNVDS